LVLKQIKKYLIASLVFCAVSCFGAADIVPLLGGNYAVPGIHTAGGSVWTTGVLAPTLGVKVRTMISERMAVDVGGYYVLRQHDVFATATANPVLQRMHQIVLPAQFVFRMDRRVSFGMGAYLGIGVGGVTNDPNARLSNGDAGLIWSVTFDIPVSDSIVVVAEGQYLFGLRDIDSDPTARFKFRDMRALLGLSFPI